MVIRFKISCRACNCTFELESEKFRDRDQLECPNCKQHFPARDYLQLKQAMENIRSICEVCAESQAAEGFNVEAVSIQNVNALLF